MDSQYEIAFGDSNWIFRIFLIEFFSFFSSFFSFSLGLSEFPNLDKLDKAILKEAYSATLVVIFEAAKINLDVAGLTYGTHLHFSYSVSASPFSLSLSLFSLSSSYVPFQEGSYLIDFNIIFVI